VSGTTAELLDLVARWVHVIAGIMWIGNSLLFNWLDRSLVRAGDERSEASVVGPRREATDPPLRSGLKDHGIGTIWLLHSGGFYFVEKTLLAGERLPKPLHWFKWQAYTTWLSGMALLLVVYYLGGRAVLADPSVHPFSNGQAIAVAIGSILVGWLLYESMNRLVAPRAPLVALAAWVIGLSMIAYWLTTHLSGRAAFLHVGAMLGTIMAGNVVFTIVPSQRELVASVEQRQSGARLAELSARAKRVSIHNNYFTFPVIGLMVINHFPGIYGQHASWMSLLIIIAGGAAVRHTLNLRFTQPMWLPLLGAALAATVLLLWARMEIGNRQAPRFVVAVRYPVTFADARHIIDRRCAACHSTTPSDRTFGPAPAGVAFDTPDQIFARIGRIRERAVVTRTMPPANKTNITDEEREMLGRWIAQGATRK
jgi:uncharacterized membrane protein